MSKGAFPDRVDAARLFAKQGRIDAALPLVQLSRLQSYLADSEGVVAVVLQFGMDAEGRRQLTGTIAAQLRLNCQRCLQAMPLSVNNAVQWLVFANQGELEKLLPDGGYDKDVLVLEEMAGGGLGGELGSELQLDVAALVEDELILSLPLAPMHEDADCSEAWNRLRNGSEREASTTTVQKGLSPFAVLAQMKGKKGNGE